VSWERSLAEYVAEGDARTIPAPAVEAARQLIRDCVAVAAAGSGEPVVAAVADLVAEDGAAPACTVIGRALRTAPAGAALVNGTAAHAIDFDDGQQPSSTHPSATMVPAILALAEKHRASGREVVAAYLYGLETMTALGLAMNPGHYTSGWHATATIGTLGAAVASARLLRLDADRITACLGIAASQAHGLRRNFGSMVKPLHAGTAARDGLVAAQLAARGVTTGDEVLSGDKGFVALLGGDRDRLDEALGALDHTFAASLNGLHIKQFPSCGVTHAPIATALRLRASHGIAPDDVESVACEVHPRLPGIVLTRPARTGLEAKFSLESCLALALVDGEVQMGQFTDARALAPEVRALAGRVSMAVDPSMGEPATWEAVLRIRLRSGQELRADTGQAAGKWRARRLSETELCDKFRACVRHGGIDDDAQESALRGFSQLEDVSEVADLVRLLGKGPRND